jgi:hypothetical protein
MGNSYSRVAQSPEQEIIKVSSAENPRGRKVGTTHVKAVLPENVFQAMLTLERRRAERSRTAFALMLIDANLGNGSAAGILKQAVEVALVTKRETDLVGWYKENAIIGVIFTDVNLTGDRPITETLRVKIENALIKHLDPEKAAKIAISLHVFPENWHKNHSGWVVDSKLYQDLDRKDSRKRLTLTVSDR